MFKYILFFAKVIKKSNFETIRVAVYKKITSMRFMLNYIFSYKYSILFAIVILIGCILSSPPDVFNTINVNVVVYENVETHEMVWLRSFQDTIAHIVLYFLLTLIFLWEYCRISKMEVNRVRTFIVVVGVPLIYGVIIEFLQEYFFPPRSAEFLDVLADLLGCLVAYFLALCYLCLRKKILYK